MEDDFEIPSRGEWPLDGEGPGEAAAGGETEPPRGPGRKGDGRSVLNLRMPMRAATGAGLVPSPAELLETVSRREVVEAPEPQRNEVVARTNAGAPATPLLYPSFPRPRRRRYHAALWSFLAIVVLPVAIAAYYYVFVAAPQYVSEFHFSVRSAASTAPQPSSSSAMSSITSQLTGSMGGSPSGADVLSNYVVVDYIMSPKAIADVSARLPLRSYFSTSAADWWARLDPAAPKEKLLDYWSHMVFATYDPATGLAAVTVRAFSPHAAHAIAAALSSSAEKLVNKMEGRARQDAVRYAQEMVDRDQTRLQKVEEKLLRLRMTSGVIDPTTSVVADNAQLVRGLETTLTQLETQYAATASQAPQAPSLGSLREQIKATRDQLAVVEAKIGTTAKGTLLPSVVGKFEAATIEEQFVQQALNNDLAALQTAQMSAISQSLYLMEEVPPTLPQSPTYPRRLVDVGLIALIAVGAWVVLALLVQTIKSRFA